MAEDDLPPDWKQVVQCTTSSGASTASGMDASTALHGPDCTDQTPQSLQSLGTGLEQGAEEGSYEAAMQFSPMEFPSRNLEADVLCYQDSAFKAASMYYWYLSLCTTGLAAARPLMMAAYGHKIPVHLVVSVASHFAVTTLLLCLRELFPAFFHDWLQELHSVMRMYVFAQAAFAAKATAASLPHLNTPFRFLLHVCFASHTTSMGIAAVTHPLRLVPNIATHAGMLVMSSGARTAACTASLTSGGALLYLQRLAQALGIPASDAVRSCPLVMYRLQMACSMALVVGGLVAEFMLRRAFLYSRWRCLGANGKQKALTWPFGDPRGVFWFIALVCGALGCCAFVWLTFV